MKEHKKGKKLRLVPLILGIYSLFLGFGLILAGAADLAGGTAPQIIGILRLLGGIGLGGLGLYGIWDGVRDLVRPEKERPVISQFIFTDMRGKRSSNVTGELLRAQIKALVESRSDAGLSLQILPPPAVGEMGRMKQISCIFQDRLMLIALFEGTDGITQVYQKRMEPEEAGEYLEQVLAGSPDFTGWEKPEMTVPREGAAGDRRQMLTVYGECWRDEHRFFSDRDLELAVDGLREGKYRKIRLELGHTIFDICPGLKEELMLTRRKYVKEKREMRCFAKEGTAAQVRFWLMQMYSGGLPEEPNGWVDITDQIKKK